MTARTERCKHGVWLTNICQFCEDARVEKAGDASDSDNPIRGSEHSRTDVDAPPAQVAALERQRPSRDKSTHEQGDQRAEQLHRQPSQPPAEIERLRREAQRAVNTMSIKASGNSGNWIDEKATLHQAIDALADLAKRIERENAALADQAFEANADAVKAYEERDEARRLHDEHCMGRLESDGSPADQPTCVPPWRPR